MIMKSYIPYPCKSTDNIPEKGNYLIKETVDNFLT